MKISAGGYRLIRRDEWTFTTISYIKEHIGHFTKIYSFSLGYRERGTVYKLCIQVIR